MRKLRWGVFVMVVLIATEELVMVMYGMWSCNGDVR